MLTLIGTRTELRPEPYGVALIMAAWNYPLHIAVAPLIGALAAGNCAVIKPSEMTPATAAAIQRLLPLYVDAEAVKVVNGGVQETAMLLKERFDYMFFTGSGKVGKIVGAAANEHLTPCTLELGGKSPVYVANDCPNLDAVAKRILWGKCLNGGQTCVAPDYVLCSASMKEELLRRWRPLLSDWFGEEPMHSPDLARVVSLNHFKRLVHLMDSSTGKRALGGEYDENTLKISPAVIVDPDPDDDLMKDEIFGPLLPVLEVNSTDEAISFINNREKPLALYLFTGSQEIAEDFAARTSSGSFVVNEVMLQMAVDSLPFGGVGASGTGAYHGEVSIIE